MQTNLSSSHNRESDGSFRVALVCMPFATATMPSIQIGLLTAIAEQAGFATDAYYFNLELAARLTSEEYEALCAHRGHMTGEWLFSIAAFGKNAGESDDQIYLAAFPAETIPLEKLGRDATYLSSLRHEVLPHYIEDCLESVDWGRYSIVGFSSTFQQNVACLALAQRIKQRYPAVKIVFGGANFEGEMGPEYVRAFEFVDYAIVGEGDIAFPTLLHRLASNKPLSNLPGLVTRTEEGIRFYGQAQPVRNMDAQPVPNFDAYFEHVKRLGLKHKKTLPFESSRGCWWGQKHHCTFCGLNGLGMSYRAKSTQRVFTELSHLARRHRVNTFQAMDNILEMRYVKDFFATIEESKTDYQFFYEVKANLSREQIRTLYRGGMRAIQPGIESMSSHVLQLMRKGCTMLQNVRTLKWCRYYGINVYWNLLWGFPGETEEDYRQELEVLKLITHLQPPQAITRIWLERFAPYFTDRESFPIHDMRPEASYSYVYPRHVALDKIAYFFDYRMESTVGIEVHDESRKLTEEWSQRWTSTSPDRLEYRRTLDALFVEDRRGSDQQTSYVFHGPLALIYEYCSETMRTLPQVLDHLQAVPEGYKVASDDVHNALERFCQIGLMIAEDGKYFSLALPVNPNW